MQLATAAEMQHLDRVAIEEYRIPGMVLMENAGRGTVDFMVSELGPPEGKLLPVFVGPGNNGGDGLVIARLVHQLGGLPFLLFCTAPDRLQGDAARNAAIAASLDLPARVIGDRDALDSAVEVLRAMAISRPVWSVVDALFGTGMKRPLTGNFLEAVRCINLLREEHGWPVTAVDLPSGLDADTGLPLGDCVRADLTATYGLAKPGHFLRGSGAVGRLRVVDIGIPPEAVAAGRTQGFGPGFVGVRVPSRANSRQPQGQLRPPFAAGRLSGQDRRGHPGGPGRPAHGHRPGHPGRARGPQPHLRDGPAGGHDRAPARLGLLPGHCRFQPHRRATARQDRRGPRPGPGPAPGDPGAGAASCTARSNCPWWWMPTPSISWPGSRTSLPIRRRSGCSPRTPAKWPG